MILGKPKIFEQFPELVFGLSKKSSQNERDHFCFNMSNSIGDSDKKVLDNRSIFFNEIGLGLENVVIQKQIHSDIINIVDKYEPHLEGDALITDRPDLGLAISTADCTNLYVYDPMNKIIAAIHSGWAGTEKKITSKTIDILIKRFGCSAEKLWVYFGPSICQKNYEVGNEFKTKFNEKYLTKLNDKYFLDLKSINRDMLINVGIPPNQIEISEVCTFENNLYHSFRRDKNNSGRALGIIAMKTNVEN